MRVTGAKIKQVLHPDIRGVSGPKGVSCYVDAPIPKVKSRLIVLPSPDYKKDPLVKRITTIKRPYGYEIRCDLQSRYWEVDCGIGSYEGKNIWNGLGIEIILDPHTKKRKVNFHLEFNIGETNESDYRLVHDKCKDELIIYFIHWEQPEEYIEIKPKRTVEKVKGKTFRSPYKGC